MFLDLFSLLMQSHGALQLHSIKDELNNLMGEVQNPLHRKGVRNHRLSTWT